MVEEVFLMEVEMCILRWSRMWTGRRSVPRACGCSPRPTSGMRILVTTYLGHADPQPFVSLRPTSGMRIPLRPQSINQSMEAE